MRLGKTSNVYELLIVPSRPSVSATLQPWKYEAVLCSGDNTNSNKNLYIILMSFTMCFYRIPLYSRITSTKSPSLCMKTFSPKLTNITILLHQLHDWTCYVSRRILAPPRLWLQQYTLIYVHANSRNLPNCDIILGSLTLSAPEARDTVKLILL
jgi:hypothetical protein